MASPDPNHSQCEQFLNNIGPRPIYPKRFHMLNSTSNVQIQNLLWNSHDSPCIEYLLDIEPSIVSNTQYTTVYRLFRLAWVRLGAGGGAYLHWWRQTRLRTRTLIQNPMVTMYYVDSDSSPNCQLQEWDPSSSHGRSAFPAIIQPSKVLNHSQNVALQ